MVVGSRRQAREAALQVLYLADLCVWETEEIPKAVRSEEPLSEKAQAFTSHLIAGVMAELKTIDPLLTRYAKTGNFGAWPQLTGGILRLATYELLHDADTPVNVIINEAVEIAKKHSTAESSKFVNGILDKIKLERKNS